MLNAGIDLSGSDLNKAKLTFCLWKAFFEKGYGLTQYAKWVIAFMGIGGVGLVKILVLGFFYVPICFVTGYFWYKYQFISAEIEVGNMVNPFVKEVREKINKFE